MHRLGYGQFFGEQDSNLDVPGFSLSLLTPNLHAEDVPLHCHAQASLIFVISGTYLSSADAFRAETGNPTLIFNPPGTVHKDSFVHPCGKYLALSLTEEASRNLHQLPSVPRAATAFVNAEIVSIAVRLYGMTTAPSSSAPFDVEAKCWELMSALAGRKIWKGFAAPPWAKSARELMQDECCTSLRFTEVARRLSVHPVTLSKGFREIFGCTAQQYLIRCRLQKALSLIRSTRRSLATIALETGFFDQSHLCRVFGREVGAAPKNFRNGVSSKVPRSPRSVEH